MGQNGSIRALRELVSRPFRMKLGRFLAKKLNPSFPSHFFCFPDQSEINSKIVTYREPPGKLNTLPTARGA